MDVDVENPTKNHQKSIQKVKQNKMRFGMHLWMALGSTLAGFWLQVGRQNGAKIEQNGLKMVVEKRVQNK